MRLYGVWDSKLETMTLFYRRNVLKDKTFALKKIWNSSFSKQETKIEKRRLVNANMLVTLESSFDIYLDHFWSCLLLKWGHFSRSKQKSVRKKKSVLDRQESSKKCLFDFRLLLNWILYFKIVEKNERNFFLHFHTSNANFKLFKFRCFVICGAKQTVWNRLISSENGSSHWILPECMKNVQ